MDPNIVYCSACDRNVRIVANTADDPAAAQSLAPVGVCLEYCADACTGSMCAVFQVPTDEMRLKLRAEGGGLNC